MGQFSGIPIQPLQAVSVAAKPEGFRFHLPRIKCLGLISNDYLGCEASNHSEVQVEERY